MIVTLDTMRRRTQRQRDRARRNALVRIRQLLQTGDYDELVVMVGTPGSGKSTWTAANDTPHRIIYDACSMTRSWRAMVRRMTRPPRMVIVYIDTPVETCIRRNARRNRIDRVPEDTIRWMHSILEPPTQREADEVITVSGVSCPARSIPS